MKYNHTKLEKKWQDKWDGPWKELFEADDKSRKPKYFVLIEFPYPSGEGLHLGHPRTYVALDIIARKRRMEGFNVLYPIGWDAFGLPTENYAIKTGQHPRVITEKNINTFRGQLKSLGLSFDWSREVNTTDPNYYKWTQWLFLQFFKHGLAYKTKMPINWCLSCKIGLANEEVVDGKCERCGGEVEKRNKEQWMLRITKYADKLIDDLKDVDFLEKIKHQQIEWIGRQEGAFIDFKIDGHDEKIKVFTTRPDTLFGATYLVLAPEHELVKAVTTSDHQKKVKKYQDTARKKSELERTELQKEKTGVPTGAFAINPANGEKIPIWIADYVLAHYGTGAIMAVPAHDERDFEFAKKFDLPIREVVKGGELPYIGEGKMKNSEKFNGLSSEEAKKKITKAVGGERARQYRLRDWVFSRQRYWGEPIPLVYCEKCANKEDAFIFHGWEGSSRLNFIPTLRQSLEERGYNAFAGDAPNTDEPNFDEWFKFAEKQLAQKGDGPLTLVGHSMGGLLVLKLAEKHKVKKLVLVAPVGTRPSEKYFKQRANDLSKTEMKIFKDYMDRDLDVKAIKKNAEQIIFMFSDDDQWITEEIRAQYKKHFNDIADIRLVKGRGHFDDRNQPLIEMLFETKSCGGWVPIAEKDLPLKLPEVKDYQPTDTGESPLAAIKDWVNVKCPKCKGQAKRETDVMPNWAGSSWYFLRYIDSKNDKVFADKKKLKKWMPVDWYNGGMEHVTLHLLYSRFWNKFFYDIGLVPVSEPYKKRTAHGLILGEDGEKMSKSRGNVINPDDIIKKHGADTLRCYEMFIGPFDQATPWDSKGVIGVRRFLEKIMGFTDKAGEGKSPELTQITHQTIKKVTEDIEVMKFNTAISQMMVCANAFATAECVSKDLFELFLKALSPFAPHLAEELWEKLGHKESILKQAWPKHDAKLAKEREIELVVQINGRVRDHIKILADLSENELKEKALASEKIKNWTKGKKVQKVIVARGRLVNIVLG